MKSRKPSHTTPPAGATPLPQLLNPEHPLHQLAEAINWQVFEDEFGKLYAEGVGRPALPTRMLAGLHHLKHLYRVSDEVVVASWVENPYWQYFCGGHYFQHRFPCDPTSLVKWRQRVGAEGIAQLLKESLATAQRQAALKPEEINCVNVGTTVRGKAIAFPTDARLYHKARRALVRLARQLSFRLRRSYERVGKKALVRQGRYAAARQLRRARRETKKLRAYLGRVLRNVERYCGPLREGQARLLLLARRILEQRREDRAKVYSVQAPEVGCIAKGKVHKRYEFGCKVRVVTTSKAGWMIGIDAGHGNPYDGATLKPAPEQVGELTGVKPEEAFVDKGYRGAQHHPAGVAVYISGRKNLSGRLRKLLRRRSAIEPVIGHTKQDHGMERNYLRGQAGDRINALLSGCGWNLKKLWRELAENSRLCTAT